MFRILALLGIHVICLTAVSASSSQCSSPEYWTNNNFTGSCTFDDGKCGYYIRQPWNRTDSYKRYYTPITAPDGGHFIVESRKSGFIDSSGRFESPDIPAGDYCLTFKYYITYSSARLLGNTTTGNIFCNLTEESLETVAWKNYSVELHETSTFKLSFLAIQKIYSFTYNEETAIVDNIVLSPMGASTTTEKTTPKSTTMSAVTTSSSAPTPTTPSASISTTSRQDTDSLSHCSSATVAVPNNFTGSCTFDNGKCGYSIRVPWNRTNTYTQEKYFTPITAPDGGHFIVQDRHTPFIDSYGTFRSPDIPAGSYCLTFSYYITYSAVRLVGNTTTGHVFCNITEKSLDTVAWKNVTVQLHETSTFQLTFTSVRVSFEWYEGKETSIVDNIVLSPMVPMTTTIAATSPSTQRLTTQNLTVSASSTPQELLRLEDAISHSCTRNGWNISINMDIMRQIYPNISEQNIYFGDNSCHGQPTGTHLIFQHGFRDCLTSERISGDTFMYENDLMYAMYDPVDSSIILQHVWTYTVECVISRDVVTSSHIQHNNAFNGHSTETGQYDVNLAFFKDANFMTQLSGNPVHINAGDYLYVKVFTTVVDWSIKMRLHTCYADIKSGASKDSNYYFIRDGCEMDSNTHIISQSTHETRFVFQDFQDTSYTDGFNVYCNATFCKSDDFTTRCLQTCNPIAALHPIVGK